MNVFYDDEVDALYLKLGDKKPEGVIEISEGVHLDTQGFHLSYFKINIESA